MKSFNLLALLFLLVLSMSFSSCEIALELLGSALEGDFRNDAGRSVDTSQDDNASKNELFNKAYQEWIQMQKSKNHEKKYVTKRYAQKYKKVEMSRLLKENDDMSSKDAKAMVEEEFNQNYFIMSSEEENKVREEMLMALKSANSDQLLENRVQVKQLEKLVKKWDPSMVPESSKAQILR